MKKFGSFLISSPDKCGFVMNSILKRTINVLILSALAFSCSNDDIISPDDDSSNHHSNVEFLRTADERFENLDGYDFEPNYVFVDDFEGGKLRMHYLDEGTENAPTIFLIHGNPTWSYQFRDVISLFNEAGYRTIAIDLMGTGRSDKPVDLEYYTYDKHVEWVAQLFEQIDSDLELGQVSIFGHDYGTPIGIRLMNEHYPNRFDAFINANASLPNGTFISPVHLNWRQFVRDNPDVPVGNIIYSQVNPALSQSEINSYNAPYPDVNYKAAIRSFPEMVPDSPDRPEAIANNDAWQFMEGFQKPFMTIFGTIDSNVFDARIDFIDRVPGAYGQPHPQLEVTHYAPEEKPLAVAEQVTIFLNDVYGNSTFNTISYSDFSDGFQDFSNAGTNTFYNPSIEAIALQANNGDNSSVTQISSMNIQNVEILKIAFRYVSSEMVTNDAFYVELWNGSEWVTLKSFEYEEDFSNSVKDYGFLRIENQANLFTNDAKVRIRNASNNPVGKLFLLDIGIYTSD
jgi:haloalkane dehalogenase